MQVLNHSGYLIKPLKAIQVRVKTFASLIKIVIMLIKTTFQDLIKV